MARRCHIWGLVIWMPAPLASHIRTNSCPAAPIPTLLSDHAAWKAVEDGPSGLASVIHVGEQEEGPGS